MIGLIEQVHGAVDQPRATQWLLSERTCSNDQTLDDALGEVPGRPTVGRQGLAGEEDVGRIVPQPGRLAAVKATPREMIHRRLSYAQQPIAGTYVGRQP